MKTCYQKCFFGDFPEPGTVMVSCGQEGISAKDSDIQQPSITQHSNLSCLNVGPPPHSRLRTMSCCYRELDTLFPGKTGSRGLRGRWGLGLERWMKNNRTGERDAKGRRGWLLNWCLKCKCTCKWGNTRKDRDFNERCPLHTHTHTHTRARAHTRTLAHIHP